MGVAQTPVCDAGALVCSHVVQIYGGIIHIAISTSSFLAEFMIVLVPVIVDSAGCIFGDHDP